MKLLKFLPLAALALVAASCQNSGGGKGLPATASQTDSLMYYLGQLNGADYLREANRDTTLKEASEKQAYINGVRAGLAALKEGNDNYNKGVMLGMQMASQMMSFSEQMDVQINRNSYISSLTNTVMADTIPNTNEAQTQFRMVMQNIENAKKQKDEAASRESLKTVAKQDGLPQITDDLYGKVTNTTDGAVIADGDEVNVEVQFTKQDGEAISVPVAPQGNVGNKRNYPDVLSDAMKSLKSGETGEFLSTAHALWGARAQQLGLEPADIVKIVLTTTLVPKEADGEAAH